MKLTDWIFKPDPYTKIPGKKELTSGKEVVELNDPTYVYIPLTNHTNLKTDLKTNSYTKPEFDQFFADYQGDVKEAFEQMTYIDGLASRKKQIVPAILSVIE